MKYLFILFLLSISISCCKTGGTHNKLVHIDSLIYNNQDDSAKVILASIGNKELTTSSDKAYYNLLKTEIIFRQGIVIQDDSMIDKSIAYYETTHDKQKLVQAYYFKGRTLYKRGEAKDGILYMKKAEHITTDIDDNILKSKIYMNIGYINLQAGEYPMALKYTQAGLKYAELSRNKEIQIACLQNISATYGYMFRPDSSIYYMKKCEPLIEFISKDIYSKALSNFAAVYIVFDTAKSQKYAYRSIEIEPNDNAYRLLAMIHNAQGNYHASDSCWDMAIKLSYSTRQKIRTLEDYLNYQQQQKRYEEAAETSKLIISLRDSLAIQQHNDSIKDVQLLYELSAIREGSSQDLNKAAIAIVVLVLALASSVMFYMRKHRKTRKRLTESIEKVQKQAKELSRKQKQIEKLEMKKELKDKQIAELKRKQKAAGEKLEKLLTEERLRIEKVVSTGKQQHESINNGGNAARWSKKDMACFVEYYEINHNDFACKLHKSYDHLTDNLKMYLILQNMEMDTEQICRVMNIKPNSLRSIRQRLKSKEKEKEANE